MGSKSAGSTFNVILSSTAFFLILLPEPTTTFIGLAMLSMLKNPKSKKRRSKHLSYHGDVSYGTMVNGHFTFQTASDRKGFLHRKNLPMDPVYSNPSIWKHLKKSINDTGDKITDFATARGELRTATVNIPSMFYDNPRDWKAYRSSSKKSAASQQGNALHGQLPQNWPNLPDYYYDPAVWKDKKKASKQGPIGYIAGTPHGQLPLPWPNMPETRFTTKLHRDTR
jgi:hypothetical protein